MAGCPSERAGVRWSTRSPRRSRSWLIARARSFGLMWCTGCWSRWGMRGRIARRGGRSRRPSAVGEQARPQTRPWIPQPGLWLQWDYGDGPEVAGSRAVLFCAWLAWSRFRVVVPLRDKTLPSVVIGLDRTLRMMDGVPTYALTDNEKTVTVEHVAGIAVRNATIVEVSRHYGLTIATCEPADPQSKGGSEATVKIAKADLVPTDHNLREQYADWRALERACQEFMADVNTRPHRSTRQPPLFLLAQEHEHLHRLPRLPHTLCFGQTRKVDRQATVSRGGRDLLGPARADRRAGMGPC